MNKSKEWFEGYIEALKEMRRFYSLQEKLVSDGIALKLIEMEKASMVCHNPASEFDEYFKEHFWELIA